MQPSINSCPWSQISLQAMNATLTELKLDQDQDQDQAQAPEEDQPPPLPSDTSALWTAVERLDNMVVNNTVKVGPNNRTHKYV